MGILGVLVDKTPFTLMLRGLALDEGGVEGGGVDAADEEVDTLEDPGESWRASRGIGSLPWAVGTTSS